MGKQWKQCETLFSWDQKSLQMVTATMKLKDTCSLGKKLDSILKNRHFTLLTKFHLIKAMVFLVVMYGCESWTTKAEHQGIDTFELWCWRRLLSPLDWKEIKPVILKGNQPWILIGRTDAEAPILCPPDVKSQLIEKTLILGKTEGKRRGQCRMSRQHHQLNG